MNDDPAEVHVLYGKVNALSWSHSLQTIADSLVGEFIKTGQCVWCSSQFFFNKTKSHCISLKYCEFLYIFPTYSSICKVKVCI